LYVYHSVNNLEESSNVVSLGHFNRT
jgi:hypothetical protein